MLKKENRYRSVLPQRFLAACMAVLGAPAGWAETVGETSGEIVELSPFVIEGEVDPVPPGQLGPLENPVTPVLSLTARLDGVPGVSLVSRGALAMEPMIRGQGFDRVATRLNGLPLESGSPTRTHAPIQQFGSLQSRTIKITAALPSLADGPPATGGAIELGPAADELPRPGSAWADAFSLSLTAMPDRQGLGGTALYEGGKKRFFQSISIYHFATKNYTSGEGKSVPSSHSMHGGSLSLLHKSMDGGHHGADLVFNRQGFTENASLPLDTERGDFLAFAASHRWKTGNRFWEQWRARYGYARTETVLSNARRARRPMDVRTGADTENAHLDIRFESAPIRETRLLFGFDLNQASRMAVRTRGSSAQDFIWPDIRYRQAGAFLEARRQLSGRIHLRTGVRVDRIGTEARAGDETAFGQPIVSLYREYSGNQNIATKQTETLVSANFLAEFEATGSLSLHAGIGSSAQAPPPTERYRAFLNALGGGFEVGNPALEAERKREFIVGGDWRGESLHFRAEGYIHWMEDYLFRQKVGSTAGVLPLDPAQEVFSYRNVDAQLHGMEWQATWCPIPNFQIPVSVEWIHGELREYGPGFAEGDSLPELPPIGWKIAAQWMWRISVLSGQLEWTIEGSEGRKNPLPKVNPLYRESEDFRLHHLAFNVRSSSGFTLTIAIHNVFDQFYASYLTPPVAAIAPASGDLATGENVPGPGREIRMVGELRF